MLCSEKHRGFAFVEFELAEDAAAAVDNLASYLVVSCVKRILMETTMIFSIQFIYDQWSSRLSVVTWHF